MPLRRSRDCAEPIKREIQTETLPTVALNKTVNERKGFWITLGATALFVAVPFVVLAGVLAAIAFLGQPFRPS